MATVTAGDFEWDDAKANANFEKHGISFEQGALALLDPRSVELEDPTHPNRVITLGLNLATGILYVVWCEGGAERARIISARKARAHEHRQYQEAR
jgi:uncharacterized DUF497 family protein